MEGEICVGAGVEDLRMVMFECPRGTKYRAYVLAHRGNTSVRVPVL
jgi:hypothetical protein